MTVKVYFTINMSRYASELYFQIPTCQCEAWRRGDFKLLYVSRGLVKARIYSPIHTLPADLSESTFCTKNRAWSCLRIICTTFIIFVFVYHPQELFERWVYTSIIYLFFSPLRIARFIIDWRPFQRRTSDSNKNVLMLLVRPSKVWKSTIKWQRST